MKKLLLMAVALFMGTAALAATSANNAQAAAEGTSTIHAYIFSPEMEHAQILVRPAGYPAYGPAESVTVEVKKGTQVTIQVLFDDSAPAGSEVEFWYGPNGVGSFVGQNPITFTADKDYYDINPSIVVGNGK